MIIDSNSRGIKEVLESGYYKIPRFQRPYSWDKANVEEFWQDTVQNREAEYFIGSMVVFRDKKDKTAAIVDGQQRLTTITMLLCAIRNELDSNGFSDLAAGIQTLVERKNIDNRIQSVLSTETSYPYLQEHIQKFGPPELATNLGTEEKHLSVAFEFLSEQVAETVTLIKRDPSLDEKRKQNQIRDKLLGIRNKVLELEVIFIELENEDDAYLVFETLNTRGKNLNVSDLVKNHITRLIKPRTLDVDVARDKWNEMRASFEESEADIRMSTFIHHFWLSRYDFVSKKKLFKQIKKRVTKGEVKDFLDDLSTDAEMYRMIHEPNVRKKDWAIEQLDIKASLEALNLFKIQLSLPVTLSAMREWEAQSLKLKNVRNILKALECFHFIFNAVTSQRSSGGISMMFASHGRRLFEAKDSKKLEICRELIGKLRDRRPSFREFEVNFGEILYTSQRTKQKALVRYILKKISEHHRQALDLSRMTVEHLMSESAPGFDDAVGGQLGNLLLVEEKINANELRNKEFNLKKEVLTKHKIFMDSWIESANTWSKTEIIERTRGLAKLAYHEIWKI